MLDDGGPANRESVGELTGTTWLLREPAQQLAASRISKCN
jgi:hypothetical protein